MKISQKLIIAANSMAYYLLSYFIVFILHQAFTIISASIFGFDLEIDYTDIRFLVSRYAWYFDSVKIIYSAGPLACLLLAVFMIVVAFRYREYSGKLKLFFLWGFVHSLSMLLGSAYAGSLLGEGFGHVLIWMFLPDTGKLIITLISLFLLAAAGFAITRLFLLSGNSYYNNLKTEDITSFLNYQLIIPFIAGTMIIILLRLPVSFYELLRIVTPVMVVFPVWLNSQGSTDLYYDETPRKIKISGNLIIAALVILGAYRIVLNYPVQF
ncbi:MAG TPA: hypothetical protein PLG29_12630 [Lentimicrobium sp.]|nr:hypothetical protein [Lentimicrobium sp.]